MASQKRTSEQNKEIYRRRVERAKTEGYSGYGQKRYRTEKQTKLERLNTQLREQLETNFPGIVVWDELPADRQRAFERLETSGKFTQEELDSLRQAGDNFWQVARPMFERTSP